MAIDWLQLELDVGAALLIAAALGALVLRLKQWRNDTGLRILVWHSVSPGRRDRLTTPLAQFERQLAWLVRRGYSILSFTEVVRRHEAGQPLPPRSIVLTFDDGCATFRDHALPALQKWRLPAVTLVPAAVIEADAAAGGGPLTLEDLRRLPMSVEIGLHSYAHCDYSRIGGEAVAADIARCEAFRRALGPRLVPAFAYPYGRTPPLEPDFARMARQLQALGTRMAMRLGYGVNAWPLRDTFRLRRICIHGTDSFPCFMLKVMVGRVRL